MKTRTTLITASMAAALALTGTAFAAGTGGGSSSENGATGGATGGTTGGGAAANGVYPAPTQGVEQGATATGDTGTTGTTTHKSKHKHWKHHAQKPANDTTNIPGADASSDTKGQ